MNVAIAKGHRYPSGGREMYDGRITYPTDDLPEMLEVDGVLYGRIVEVDDIRTLGQGDTWLVSKVTPEDGMWRETRGTLI